MVTIVDMNEHRIVSSFAMEKDLNDHFKYAMEFQ